MTIADRHRWDRRHAEAARDQPDALVAPDVLSGSEDLLPAGGRALDVACGRGAVSVWLAQRGFLVEAVDVSPVALARGAALAAVHGVGERVRFWEHDLDAGLPAALKAGFALVVCQRFRDPALYPQLERMLAPGGLLAISVLSSGSADAGPFRAQPGELLSAFPGLQTLAHREADGQAHLLASAPR